jgi:hypothetical protein
MHFLYFESYFFIRLVSFETFHVNFKPELACSWRQAASCGRLPAANSRQRRQPAVADSRQLRQPAAADSRQLRQLAAADSSQLAAHFVAKSNFFSKFFLFTHFVAN